jgi:putative addiction module component (TIGR02574 family)
MARSVAQISEEIQALSASDQEALLRALLEQIDGLPDPSADAAWLAEAQRRSREIDEGTVRCIPADEVFARLSSQLK